MRSAVDFPHPDGPTRITNSRPRSRGSGRRSPGPVRVDLVDVLEHDVRHRALPLSDLRPHTMAVGPDCKRFRRWCAADAVGHRGRRRPRGGSGRAPDDEPVGWTSWTPPVAGSPRRQQPAPPAPLRRRRPGGSSSADVGGDVVVVEADDRQVLGHARPASRATCIAPIAISSEQANTAVGGSVSASSRCIASAPPSSEKLPGTSSRGRARGRGGQRLAVAAEAVDRDREPERVVLDPADQRDPLVAEPEQVADGSRAAATLSMAASDEVVSRAPRP
jgi:hypothetical protein